MENEEKITSDEVSETKTDETLESVENETRPEKNEAAVLLGKLRWREKSDEEKSAHGKMMVRAREAKRAEKDGVEIEYR